MVDGISTSWRGWGGGTIYFIYFIAMKGKDLCEEKIIWCNTGNCFNSTCQPKRDYNNCRIGNIHCAQFSLLWRSVHIAVLSEPLPSYIDERKAIYQAETSQNRSLWVTCQPKRDHFDSKVFTKRIPVTDKRDSIWWFRNHINEGNVTYTTENHLHTVDHCDLLVNLKGTILKSYWYVIPTHILSRHL